MSTLPPLPKKQVTSQAAYDTMRGALRRVAKYQRWVLLALLLNVVFVSITISNALELVTLPASISSSLEIIRFPVCVFMSIAIFLLAKQFWHVAIAAFCVALIWIPVMPVATALISFLVLLVVNQKATRFLQLWGIKVGLLGANPARV
jgi:hypothetical protein